MNTTLVGYLFSSVIFWLHHFTYLPIPFYTLPLCLTYLCAQDALENRLASHTHTHTHTQLLLYIVGPVLIAEFNVHISRYLSQLQI